jgi:four helix bundle protein
VYVFEGYNSYKDFTTLEAWKKARELKLFFYAEILPGLPGEEKYNLGIQIRRASVSVTANISEGYGRYNHQECVQFYRISRGSIYELKDHLTTCLDLNFIDIAQFNHGLTLIEDAKKTLNGYIKYVMNNKSKMKE